MLGCKGLKKGGKSFFHEYAEDEEHKSTQDVVKPVLSSHPQGMAACQSLIQVDEQMTCPMFVCKLQC